MQVRRCPDLLLTSMRGGSVVERREGHDLACEGVRAIAEEPDLPSVTKEWQTAGGAPSDPAFALSYRTRMDGVIVGRS